jgi:hypothetical protein
MNILKIKNSRGVPFNVIMKTESEYNGCDKVVHIYDDRFHKGDWKELGQFVSSYYTSTFLDIKGGLNMYGGVEDWVLSEENVKEIQWFILKNTEKI